MPLELAVHHAPLEAMDVVVVHLLDKVRDICAHRGIPIWLASVMRRVVTELVRDIMTYRQT